MIEKGFTPAKQCTVVMKRWTYLVSQPSLHILDLTLAQFILDCTSFNLPDSHRIDVNCNHVATVFNVSRDFCYAVHSSRMEQLKYL